MLSQLTPVHSSSQMVLFLDQCVIYVRSESLTRGRIAKRWDGRERNVCLKLGTGMGLGRAVLFCLSKWPVQDSFFSCDPFQPCLSPGPEFCVCGETSLSAGTPRAPCPAASSPESHPATLMRALPYQDDISGQFHLSVPQFLNL